MLHVHCSMNYSRCSVRFMQIYNAKHVKLPNIGLGTFFRCGEIIKLFNFTIINKSLTTFDVIRLLKVV